MNTAPRIASTPELATVRLILIATWNYEGFAAAWPGRTGEFADRFNSLPKYVASSTLKQLEWKGSELLQGSLPDALMRLKHSDGGDIVVHGSVTLVQSLMDHDLIDQYHVLVYPVVIGSGKRLFRAGQQSKFQLVDSTVFGSGVAALTYQPERS
jgi:dihydrofolate reductase